MQTHARSARRRWMSRSSSEFILALANFSKDFPRRAAGKSDRLCDLGNVGAQERIGRLLGADGRWDRSLACSEEPAHLLGACGEGLVVRLDGLGETNVR